LLDKITCTPPAKTSTLKVSNVIPSIHKIKLHEMIPKRGMSYLKLKKREKMACPRRMTQKNRHINIHEKKKENIYIAMSSCYPNKGDRGS